MDMVNNSYKVTETLGMDRLDMLSLGGLITSLLMQNI